jgi:hypothetical protein
MKALPKSQIFRFTEKTIHPARRAVSRYSSKFSKHRYTLPQHVVLLRLKVRKNTTYRGLLDELIEGPRIRRALGLARTLNETAVVSRVDSLEIKRTYRYVVRELDVQIPPTDPIEYVGRIVSKLDCSDDTTRQARQLIEAATAHGVHSGKNPVGIAASAIYAAGRPCGEHITQDDVSEAANVSNVTIRNRYREVLNAYDEREKD